MLRHLKPIQFEMLSLFKSHIVNNIDTAFIDKTEIQKEFNDIPLSVVIHYMEDLVNQNIIEIDWKQCNQAHINIKIQFKNQTLEYLDSCS